jgi:hypothetical protein
MVPEAPTRRYIGGAARFETFDARMPMLDSSVRRNVASKA